MYEPPAQPPNESLGAGHREEAGWQALYYTLPLNVIFTVFALSRCTVFNTLPEARWLV